MMKFDLSKIDQDTEHHIFFGGSVVKGAYTRRAYGFLWSNSNQELVYKSSTNLKFKQDVYRCANCGWNTTRRMVN